MSESKAAEAPAPAGPSKAPMLLALVNTLAVLAAVGTLYYTKIMYKRPEITEDTERKRLEAAHAQKTVTEATAPGSIAFGPFTVNIQSYPAPLPSAASDSEEGRGAIKGKLHYVTMAFAIEVVDGGQKAAIEEVRPVIMDQLLTTLSHKPFHELTTVQGRYILRTQIMEMVNRLTQTLPSHPPLLASAAAKPAEKDAHGGGGHGAPPAAEHGAPAADGGHGGGGGHGESKDAKAGVHLGPPMKELYPDGLASSVYFTQFIVQ